MEFRIEALDHVQLAMPPGEEDTAEAFYAGLLGLERLPKPEPLARRGGCWFSNGDATIHLGTEEGFRPAKKAHPAFQVRHLDNLIDAMKSAGIAVRLDTERPGVHRCYVDDPFGNRIELIDVGDAAP